MLFILPFFHAFCFSAQKKEVLAVNEVIATYMGPRHIPCMFRTALCPNHCDHAHDVYVFKINEYVKYEKLGKYGDDQETEFLWDSRASSDTNKLHPEYLQKVKDLEIGQMVKINWNHFYITDENGAYPERSVIYFEQL